MTFAWPSETCPQLTSVFVFFDLTFSSHHAGLYIPQIGGICLSVSVFFHLIPSAVHPYCGKQHCTLAMAK